MEKEALRRYIYFGGIVQYLRFVGEQTPIHGDSYILYNLKRLEDGIEALDLPVSQGLIGLSGLSELREELEQTEENANLTASQAKRLQELMKQMSDTILVESDRKSAFIVGPKRWDSDHLLESPAELFSPGVYNDLPEPIRQDLAAACRCIAFELPTSVAFHLMRAIEALVRDFYCSLVKRNRVKPLLWGPMVEHLRKRSAAPPSVILDQLDHIRINFRNPTQHPDAFYDIQEAQDLFGVCVDAIHRVSKEMK